MFLVVTPVKTGVQAARKNSKMLDSGARVVLDTGSAAMTGKRLNLIFCELLIPSAFMGSNLIAES